jgi:membrane protein
MMRLWEFVKRIGSGWSKHAVPRQAAALAFYTLLSLAPLLLVLVSIAGYWFGQQAAEGKILNVIHENAGEDVALLIRNLLLNAGHSAKGPWAVLIGITLTLIGASNVFHQLKYSLDTLWEVPLRRGGVRRFFLTRLLSVSSVLMMSLLLLMWILLDVLMGLFLRWVQKWSLEPVLMNQTMNWLFSWAGTTLVFGFLYKVLPDTNVRWRDVWLGAGVAAFLFSLSKWLLGWYLAFTGTASLYGAAGALVVLLLWVYFSAQIFLLGALMTTPSREDAE